MKILPYYLWIFISMIPKLEPHQNGPLDNEQGKSVKHQFPTLLLNQKSHKANLFAVGNPNGVTEASMSFFSLVPSLHPNLSQFQGISSNTSVLENPSSWINGSSLTNKTMNDTNISAPYVNTELFSFTHITEPSGKIDQIFNYVIQETLAVQDTSHEMLPFVHQIISKGNYSDIFDSQMLSALENFSKLSSYSNETWSQQSLRDSKYVKAIVTKGEKPFLYTGKPESRTRKNCYVIRTNDKLGQDTKARIREVLEAIGGKIRFSYDADGLEGFAVCFPDNKLPIILLKSIIGLQWVERDQYASTTQVQEGAPWQLARLNDPNTDLSEKMDYTFNATGNGVNVYVIDSGVMTEHPEFGGRAKVGYSVFDKFPEDCAGHGTQVSSVIGGVNVGVAKQANIIVLQILDCDGQGENSSVLSALNWIINNHAKPAVINMSVGGPKSVSVDEAVQAAVDAGLAVVVAAGNSQIDACVLSPSGVEAAMVVGASTYDMKRASFSNFGGCVELFAPGSHVVAAAIPSQATTNGFGLVSGTSLSAPLVTGIYALLLQVYPNASPLELKQKIMNASATGILDRKTLLGSPNLLAKIPLLPNSSIVDLDFLPSGTLPYLLPPSTSNMVELVLIIVSASLIPLFLLIILVLLWRRHRKKKHREAKFASAFH